MSPVGMQPRPSGSQPVSVEARLCSEAQLSVAGRKEPSPSRRPQVPTHLPMEPGSEWSGSASAFSIL